MRIECVYNCGAMPQKTPLNMRIEPELLEGLQRVRDAIGIPVSEQIRRAVRIWLEDHGELEPAASRTKTARKRAATRSRA
jgi:hypothetical protein